MLADPSFLVVVEKDSVCPYWMDHWGPDPEGDWSMLEQEEWEPDAAFAERLQTALARSSEDGGNGEVVVFVTSSQNDAAGMTERWNRATSLMTHLARFSRGRLVLTRGYGYDDADDPMLYDLAEELQEAWADAGISVCVHTATDESGPDSRVDTIAPPPPEADVVAA